MARELRKGYAVRLLNGSRSDEKADIVEGYLFDSDVSDCPICVWKDENTKHWHLSEVNTGLKIGYSYRTRKEAINDFDMYYAEQHARLIRKDSNVYKSMVAKRVKIEKELNL